MVPWNVSAALGPSVESAAAAREREFFIDNLLVRIRSIIEIFL
jgi:hypothetical protein